MTTISTHQAVQNLDRYIAEDRLITESWSRMEKGRELGCLLYALGDKEYRINSPEKCPVNLMPTWLAFWAFTAYDGAGTNFRYSTARLFRAALENTAGYTSREWERLRVEFLCLQIQHALDAARPVNE